MALDNVSIFHGALVATGKKIKLDQYELEIKVEGEATDAGNKAKKSKQQVLAWPDAFELLPQDEQEEIMREVLIRFARTDTEATAAKEA